MNQKLVLESNHSVVEPIKDKNESKTEKTVTNEVQQYYNRDVWFVTSNAAKTKIESRNKQLEKISTEILTNGDLAHEEKEAHKFLCETLRQVGCEVHSNYIHPTGFKAVYQSATVTDSSVVPTVGLICEYDAVKGFGHSSGNNLLTEASIATLIGIKEAMKSDTRLIGRLIVFGTPASEESGGKIRMMKEGAFDKIDLIVAVSPSDRNCLLPKFYCSQKVRIMFLGRDRHIDCLNLIESHNAVDALNICYSSLMSVSNQIQPKARIHCIIKKGGDVDYLVPKKTELIVIIRGQEMEDLDLINRRVVDCGEGAANITQTKVEFLFFDEDMYCCLNHNKVLANVFKEETKQLGIDFNSEPKTKRLIYRSTDLGNVSHKVPLICPTFSIGTNEVPPVHTKDFANAITRGDAQKNTLKISIAMTFTIIKYLLNPDLQNEVRKQFQSDFEEMNKRANKTKANK